MKSVTEPSDDLPVAFYKCLEAFGYPNRSAKDTGLGQFSADDQKIVNTDNLVWLTTGTTHVARAEEWPIMPTEWVNVLLKPWTYFSETSTLHLGGAAK